MKRAAPVVDRVSLWDSMGTEGTAVEIVPHRAEWEELYRREAEAILRACHGLVVTVEHIGSTAIAGLAAKPILDLMPGVRSLRDAEGVIAPMEALGYLHQGEHGIPNRRYFEKYWAGRRVAHAHLFEIDTRDWRRHLIFREYLRDHPEVARDYETLKRALALRHREDRTAYTEAKSEFILGVLERAGSPS